MARVYKLDTHEEKLELLMDVFNLPADDVLNVLVNRSFNEMFGTSLLLTILVTDYPECEDTGTVEPHGKVVPCKIVGMDGIYFYKRKVNILCTFAEKTQTELETVLVANAILVLKAGFLLGNPFSPKNKMEPDLISESFEEWSGRVPESSSQMKIITEEDYSLMSATDKEALKSHLSLLKKISEEIIKDEDRESWPKPDSF